MSSLSARKAMPSPSLLKPVQFGMQAMTYAALDGATYMLRLTVDMPEEIRGKSVMLTPAGLTKECPPDHTPKGALTLAMGESLPLDVQWRHTLLLSGSPASHRLRAG